MIVLQLCSPVWQYDTNSVHLPCHMYWMARPMEFVITPKKWSWAYASRSRSWTFNSIVWGRASRLQWRTLEIFMCSCRVIAHCLVLSTKWELILGVMLNVSHRWCTWVMSWCPNSTGTWKPSVPITNAKIIIPCNKCQTIQFTGWSRYCGIQNCAIQKYAGV
jgi:hypothetical protein